jgi:hypothetical protein
MRRHAQLSFQISEKAAFDPVLSSMLSSWSHGTRVAPKNQSSHPSASGSVEGAGGWEGLWGGLGEEVGGGWAGGLGGVNAA